jgi:hypothetical protein
MEDSALRRRNRQARLEAAAARVSNARKGGYWLYPSDPLRLQANNRLLLERIAEVRLANGTQAELPPYALGMEMPAYLIAQSRLGNRLLY